MIANVEKVIEWLDNSNLKYWTVTTKDGDNTKIFEVEDNENFEQAVERFRKTMEISYGTKFHIRAKSNKAAGRGMFHEVFDNIDTNISQPASQHVVSGIPNVGYVTTDEMDRRVSEAINRTMKDYELAKLKEENSELRRQVQDTDNTTQRVMKKIEPYIGTVLGNIVHKIMPNAPQVAVAGLEDTETDIQDAQEVEMLKTDENRLQTALEKWQTCDPDFITVIEIISRFAVSGESIYMGLGYAQLKEMLLKTV